MERPKSVDLKQEELDAEEVKIKAEVDYLAEVIEERQIALDWNAILAMDNRI